MTLGFGWCLITTMEKNGNFDAVARAVRSCAERPQSEWPSLVRSMAVPGFALTLGRMLLIADEMKAEGEKSLPDQSGTADGEGSGR